MKRLFFLVLAGIAAYCALDKWFDFLVEHIQWVGLVAVFVGSLGFSKHMATLDRRKQLDPSKRV